MNGATANLKLDVPQRTIGIGVNTNATGDGGVGTNIDNSADDSTDGTSSSASGATNVAADTTASSSSTSTITTPSTAPSVTAQTSNNTSAELTSTVAINVVASTSTNANTSTTPSNVTASSNASSTANKDAYGGSLSDLPSSADERRTPNVENLSKTNLYIRGLQTGTSDQDLYNMCARFGAINSTKAIQDKLTNQCKGYGFVQFVEPKSAEVAVRELTKSGVQAQMARISLAYSSRNHHQPHHQSNHHHHHQPHHHPHSNHHHHHHHNINNGSNGGGGGNNHNNGTHNNNAPMHNHNSSSSSSNNNNNNADPTNLYIANLPPNMSEPDLESLLSNYGPVISTRILRDMTNHNSRGVGFARMETMDKCQEIIEKLNGKPCKGSLEPLLVKFADGGNKKRPHAQHHSNNHHQHQHHHKMHQDERWRESGNLSADLSNLSTFEQQGNIPQSTQLSDLAMMGALGYQRMQPAFPPALAPGGPYPTNLGPSTSAPQWIPGPAQPWNVITPQMLQAGGLGPSNQAAAAANFQFSHIPHLTSQMQGLQIAPHPGAPVGGYMPPQHQWSGMWPHPMAPPPQQAHQSQVRIAAGPMLNAPSQQQPQQAPTQQPGQTVQEQPTQQKQPSVTDHKLQVSAPL